jgi:proteic killer suppression protein
MVVRFNNAYLEKLYQGKAVSKKPRYSRDVVLIFKKTMLILQAVENIKQLGNLRGLNFEPLKGKLKGKYSVRLNLEYRLIVSVLKDRSSADSEVLIIEELTNHYR